MNRIEKIEALRGKVEHPEQLSDDALEMLFDDAEFVTIPESMLSAVTTPLEIHMEVEEGIAAQSAGDLIGRARALRGLSMRELATRMGISSARVSQVQHSGESLEVQTLARYAEALGYHLSLALIPKEGGEPITALLEG